MGARLSCSSYSPQTDEDFEIVEALNVVKELWKRVEPLKVEIGTEVYKRLMEEHIEYRILFKNTSIDQMPKFLINMIGNLVKEGSPERMSARLCRLGKLHVEFGVPLDSFYHFREVFIKGVKRVCGIFWCDEHL
eukprot:TRINITY_DN3070_c0_g1_i1.p1 TRINITY_DN3070_c0_g1~~TRINITY_DN3070_c0_g1_i1.p1  ORF type:complete len:134 (-),score=20.95 TRINITY_DN3070_c0_g1_i1:756-1157(-)